MNTKFKIGDIVKYNGDVYQINGIEGTQENQYMYRVRCIKQMDSDSYPCCGIGCSSEERMELYDFNEKKKTVFNAADDKNKIRAEVERLLNKEWKWQSSTEGKYRCETYRELLEFIDSLPEESVSEELEKEIDEYYNQKASKEFELVLYDDICKFAIHFANWQKEQTINKACKWLERNTPYGVVSHERVWDMVQEFRKEMEAEK